MNFSGDAIFNIGNFPITNTLIDTLIVDLLIIIGIFALRNLKKIPNFFQNSVELVIDGFYSLTSGIAPKQAYNIFPYFMSFFIFIIIANLTGLFPGFGTIGFFKGKELIPLLRASTSDINTTLGLALVSAVATHILAIKATGVREYLSRYFSLNPIYLFVGFLELIGEFTKIISLSFRLFGNIFAGEVVISTISNIFAFLAPLPFLGLEVIVGIVQALVFAMLTMVFMAILTTSHNEGGEHK